MPAATDQRLPSRQQEDAYFDHLITLMEERQELWTPAGGHVTVTFPDNKPVMLVFTADWHVGHPFCNYRQLKTDLELINSVPGVYPVGMGDYKHNPKLGHPAQTSLYEGGLSDPMEQDRAVLWYMRMCQRWPLLITGNHDHWDRKFGGVDNFDQLCRKLQAKNLGHGGSASFFVGGEEYVGVLYHQYGGKTGLKRMLSDYAALSPDFCVNGHLHYREMSQASAHQSRNETVLLRCGTYEAYDDYAAQKGLHGEYGIPSVILYPREHRVLPFSGNNFPQALDFYRSLR
jgi:hypothetical protein